MGKRRREPKHKYACDFEVTNHATEERVDVYAWGVCPVGKPDDFAYGTTINGFMEWIELHHDSLLYFHNLKYDGKFIIPWLYQNGFKHTTPEDDDHETTKTFSTFADEYTNIYSIDIVWTKQKRGYKRTLIWDSFKLMPSSLKKIGESYKLGYYKVDDYDHSIIRTPGTKLTQNEIEYLKGDVQTLCMALQVFMAEDYTRMTIGANALKVYKASIGGDKRFLQWFPELDPGTDSAIRKAYRGGFTYLKPEHAGKELGAGMVYDVNSLYPYCMVGFKLPYGEPKFFTGKYEHDEKYPLYVQRMTFTFKLKPGKLPTIQIKNSYRHVSTEYLSDSGNQPETLTLTNVDLELILDHYDIIVHEYIDGYKFKQAGQKLFGDYVGYFMKQKEESTGAEREIAKLFLNNLYGKFGTNPIKRGKVPFWDESEQIVKWETVENPPGKSIYIPVAVFVTAYARNLTIRSAQEHFARFIYADTDSLHLLGTEQPNLEIHKTKIGLWDFEGTFEKAKFIRSKTYMEVFNGKPNTKAAGVSKDSAKLLTWETFFPGNIIKTKKSKTVVNGVKIVDKEHTL
jgi:hypothetical protein